MFADVLPVELVALELEFVEAVDEPEVDEELELWAAVTVRVTVLVDAAGEVPERLPDWLEPQPAISATTSATSAGAAMRMRPIAVMLGSGGL